MRRQATSERTVTPAPSIIRRTNQKFIYGVSSLALHRRARRVGNPASSVRRALPCASFDTSGLQERACPSSAVKGPTDTSAAANTRTLAYSPMAVDRRSRGASNEQHYGPRAANHSQPGARDEYYRQRVALIPPRIQASRRLDFIRIDYEPVSRSSHG
jgi:hypothetical protein